jgi:hypothetical protein
LEDLNQHHNDTKDTQKKTLSQEEEKLSDRDSTIEKEKETVCFVLSSLMGFLVGWLEIVDR